MAPVVTASRRRPAGKGRGPGLWAALGVVVAGGVAAFLLIGKDEAAPAVDAADGLPVTIPAGNAYGESPKPGSAPSTVALAPVASPTAQGSAVAGPGSGPSVSGAGASSGEAIEEVIVPEEEEKKPKRPKNFKHPTEELLGLMMSTPPTCPMPPLPQLDPADERLNVDALLATTNLLVIYEDDDEKTAALKEEVATAKFQLASVITNGGSVAEALTELRDYQNTGVEVRKEVIRNVNGIADDGEAYEYLQEANEALKKEDIVPVEMDEVGMEVVE